MLALKVDKRSILNGTTTFLKIFIKTIVFKGTVYGGTLKISLLHCYGVLWVHCIESILFYFHFHNAFCTVL